MTDRALSTMVIDRGSGTAIQQLQERMRTILEVMANVLEEGKDYGRIPGTDKPTLYKPGAEKLMLTFNLAPAEPKIEDLSTADEVRYRVGVPIEGSDGRQRWGIGEASSNEEKYRWRKPVCEEEFADTPEHLRREKWFKGKERPYKGQQIRTSPADVANTILKMAHKRGFIHGTLLATGASSVFNQDLEDFTKEMQDAIVEADATTAPKKTVERASAAGRATPPAAPNGNRVTEPRRLKAVRDVLIAKGKNAGKTMYVLLLEGDKNEYTTYDVTLAKEAESFVGTDHLVRVGYETREWQGKTYYNAKTLAIADADLPAAATGDPSPLPFAG